MSAPEQDRTVARWKMERGELVFVGTCRAPEPRAAVGQEDASVDPLEQSRLESDERRVTS